MPREVFYRSAHRGVRRVQYSRFTRGSLGVTPSETGHVLGL